MIKRLALVLHCLACGFRRTQIEPIPEKCPRCEARLTHANP